MWEAFESLGTVLSRRHSLIDRNSECSVVLDDALCLDVQRCLTTAETMVKFATAMATETSTHIEATHEIPLPVSEEPGATAVCSPQVDPPVSTPTCDEDRPLEIRSRELSERPSPDPFEDQTQEGQVILDSDDDPEPDFQQNFPPAVYAEFIAALQLEMQTDMKANRYDKAEVAYHKVMKYLVDRERDLKISYDHDQMDEILAEIYFKQKQYDNAKRVLYALLKRQENDNDRKWRLYHMLAELYLEQDRLIEAEKFGKRAYIGRDKLLGKGHGLILQSAALLVKIYELSGEADKAQAFRNLHDSTICMNKSPQITKHVGTRRVNWNPDISVDINAPTKSGETPLVTAVSCGDDEMLHRVLQGGADIEVRSADGRTPLMHAVWHGHEKIAGVLLSRGAQVDARTGDWTPLHKAADMGRLDLVKLLLQSGADIEAKSPKKLILNKPASDSVKTGRALSDEDDSDDSDTSHGWTALLRASHHGNEAVARILIDHNADIEARSPSKATPLIYAAETQHEALVDLLLIRGAIVEVEDEFGWKPLHRTLVKRGGEKVAQRLIDHDANINPICAYKKTPLHYAVEKNDEGMACFLLRAGAAIEARDVALRTPLHTAIECRRENMVYVLLEFGADASAHDKSGRDALAAANHTLRKSPEIVKLLTKHKRSKIATTNNGGDPRRMSSTLSSASTIVSGSTPISSARVSSKESSGGSWWSRKNSKNKSQR